MSEPITSPSDPRLNDTPNKDNSTLRPATMQEIDMAAEQFEDNDIQIDDDAQVAEIEGSKNIWVQAWLYVKVGDDD